MSTIVLNGEVLMDSTFGKSEIAELVTRTGPITNFYMLHVIESLLLPGLMARVST